MIICYVLTLTLVQFATSVWPPIQVILSAPDADMRRVSINAVIQMSKGQWLFGGKTSN